MLVLISYESRHSTDYTNYVTNYWYYYIVHYIVLYVSISSCHCLLGLQVYGSMRWVHCTCFVTILVPLNYPTNSYTIVFIPLLIILLSLSYLSYSYYLIMLTRSYSPLKAPTIVSSTLIVLSYLCMLILAYMGLY